MKLINYPIAALVLGFLAQGAHATHGGVHAMKDSRGRTKLSTPFVLSRFPIKNCYYSTNLV